MKSKPEPARQIISHFSNIQASEFFKYYIIYNVDNKLSYTVRTKLSKRLIIYSQQIMMSQEIEFMCNIRVNKHNKSSSNLSLMQFMLNFFFWHFIRFQESLLWHQGNFFIFPYFKTNITASGLFLCQKFHHDDEINKIEITWPYNERKFILIKLF